jgi:hypothetical protein
MAILEYASNLSSLLDLVLVVIGVATAGFAIKVKFVNEARKAAKEVDAKVLINTDRLNTHDRRLNSCESDIETLKERTRKL